ncbi:monocarboxylate transporter 3-like isoform X2 [Mercenaria mercenaria]|uniref:monocarboxylate transporter 3-like isoform X2 n=1 Tax=Mercenaria mercenaria TaxID=6596 RepID=UPI00234E6B0E|nr:monocarboxylate transporter 3-like isoform X2 [Mercenaria mercenaria]
MLPGKSQGGSRYTFLNSQSFNIMDGSGSFTGQSVHTESTLLLKSNGIKEKTSQLVVCSGIGYGLSVMYAELVIVFNAKRADAAWIQSLYAGLSCATGIFFAGFIKRFGPGRCIVFGGVMSGIGLFASAFASGLIPIILWTGVFAGVTTGICYLGAFIATGLMFPENASFYLISLTIGNSLGQFIVPLLFETFISQYSWAGAFILIAGVSLQCVPCGIIIHYSKRFFPKVNVSTSPTSNAFCDKSLLSDLVIWLVLLNFILNSTTGNVEAWFIVDHMISRGFPRESGSITVSVLGIGNCLGRVVGAILRFHCVNFPTINHWIYLCLINAGLHAIIINLYDYWSILVSCFVFGISFGTTVAQTPAIMYEGTGLDRYPQGMALVNIMCGLGNMFGPLLGGLIKDVLGSYDVSFYLSSGVGVYISLNTLIVAFLMRRRRRADSANSVKYSLVESK